MSFLLTGQRHHKGEARLGWTQPARVRSGLENSLPLRKYSLTEAHQLSGQPREVKMGRGVIIVPGAGYFPEPYIPESSQGDSRSLGKTRMPERIVG